MYVCPYVRMHACMYACMHWCIYASTHLGVYTCIDVCICMCLLYAHVPRLFYRYRNISNDLLANCSQTGSHQLSAKAQRMTLGLQIATVLDLNRQRLHSTPASSRIASASAWNFFGPAHSPNLVLTPHFEAVPPGSKT